MKLGRLGFAALAIAAMLALVMAGCGNPSDGTVWHPPGEQQPPPPPPPILPPTVCDCCGADCECEEPGDCGEPDCECGDSDTPTSPIPFALNLAGASEIGDLGPYIVGAGGPTFAISSAGIAITGRANDFFGIDLVRTALEMDVVANNYTVRVVGQVTGAAPAGALVTLGASGQVGGAWVAWVGDSGALSANSAFDFTANIPATFNETNFRISTNTNGAGMDFVITNITITGAPR